MSQGVDARGSLISVPLALREISISWARVEGDSRRGSGGQRKLDSEIFRAMFRDSKPPQIL